MRPTSKLHQLAKLNFHQDWDLSAPHPDGIVQNFLRAEDLADINAVIDEIVDALAHQPTEPYLKKLWDDTYRSNFEPGSIGLTHREWFARMLEILRDGSRA